MPHPNPSCCVITPVGPGHQTLAEEARRSVAAAAAADPGPFATIDVLTLDDTKARHGRSNRRNTGIEIAAERGFDWLFFLDADDLMVEQAFSFMTGLHRAYDAVWGLIFEMGVNGAPRLRAGQATTLSSLGDLLAHDPYLTLQMGHFVRTEVARQIKFDPEMDCGEDFKYYLSVWLDHRCIKIKRPFFLNRRGRHSVGPRSATGAMWRPAVERTTLAFRIDHAARLPGPPPDRRSRLVVTGYPRSGTTLVYQMLRRSLLDVATLDDEAPVRPSLAEGPPHLATKRPLDVFEMPELIADAPADLDLKVVIMIRDLRAVVTSIHRSVPDDYFIGYDHQYFVPPEGSPRYVNPGVIAIHTAIARTLQAKSDRVRVMVVRYEDLLKAPEALQERLARTFGLRYRDWFANFAAADAPPPLALALNGVRALDPSRRDAWREPKHAARIRDQFTACPQLFSLLKQYGYTDDDAWFDPYRPGGRPPS